MIFGGHGCIGCLALQHSENTVYKLKQLRDDILIAGGVLIGMKCQKVADISYTIVEKLKLMLSFCCNTR